MNDLPDTTNVVIAGGGLCGLATALLLQEAGIDYTLIEAAPRLGGRIHGFYAPDGNEMLADLGPSWVWPPYQASASKWLNKLDVAPFPQFDDGLAVVERGEGMAPERHFLPGQHGMARLDGGPQALIENIQHQLPAGNIHLNTELRSVKRGANDNFTLHVDDNGQQKPLVCQHLICALPLRLAAQNVVWDGILDEQLLATFQSAPTWMAQQAKVIAHYSSPFWRDEGLSGRIASVIGPMMEVHDNSGRDGTPAALFGFCGWPHEIRTQDPDGLRQSIISQLERCLGSKAKDFKHLHVEDWATNRHICSQLDLNRPPQHPSQLPDIVRSTHGNGLQFAVAETATLSPGLIDGALEAAERAASTCIEAMA